MDPTAGNLMQRLVSSVRRQPQKAGFLIVLLIVMGLAWAKTAGRGGPAPSSAHASRQVAAPAAIPASGDQSMTSSMRAMLEWNSQPLPVPLLQRNLFALRDDLAAALQPPAPAPAQPGISDDLEKSSPTRADLEVARRRRVQAITAEAATLELQSTVVRNGEHKALVNGMLMNEGDTILGFKIVRIEARRIVVEREGVKLEIQFRKP